MSNQTALTWKSSVAVVANVLIVLWLVKIGVVSGLLRREEKRLVAQLTRQVSISVGRFVTTAVRFRVKAALTKAALEFSLCLNHFSVNLSLMS